MRSIIFDRRRKKKKRTPEISSFAFPPDKRSFSLGVLYRQVIRDSRGNCFIDDRDYLVASDKGKTFVRVDDIRIMHDWVRADTILP